MSPETRFTEGAVIIEQGDAPTTMYVIEDGGVEVRRTVAGDAVAVASFGPGETFGELELIDGAPRLATVTATAETRCMVIDADEFADRFGRLDPFFQAVLRRGVGTLRANHDFYLANTMTTVFSERKTELADTCPKRSFAPGEVLIEQDSEPDSMFVIASGRVEVLREQDGETYRLSELGRNCIVGEIALIDLSPRAATVRAITPTEAWEISKDEFRAGFDKLDFFKAVLVTLVASIRQNHELLARLRR